MIQNWDNLEYDFKNQPSNTKLEAVFNYIGSKKITSIKPSCSCVVTNFKNNNLRCRWKLPNVKDSYESYKYIMIQYNDGSFDTLTLKVFINGKV